MKIKTIMEIKTEAFDKKVNEFSKSHEVKFTHTHVKEFQGELFLIAVLFYVARDDEND